MNDTTQPAEDQSVQCPPTRDPAVRYLIFAVMAIGLAIWCFLDRRDAPAKWDLEHINEISNYLFNNWGPVVFAPLGLIAVFAAIRQLTRTLVADQDGITYGHEQIAWEDVRAIDAAKLQSKGILYLRCEGGRAIKLDSYNMKNFKALVALIEKKLPDAERIAAS